MCGSSSTGSEKGLFRTLGPADAERVLKRPVAFTIANDHETMTQAIDRGMPIDRGQAQVARWAGISTRWSAGVAAALGLEH